ncbi:MAG: transposase [Oligoflexia bacterium]|nr:transposase [Oligoflexia bacterium]
MSHVKADSQLPKSPRKKRSPALAQLDFLKTPTFRELSRREHGGRLGEGRRKTARPMSPRLPLHVILRSTKAKGDWSLLKSKHEKRVKHLTYALARKFHVKVYRFANAGNHLHLVLKAKHKDGFKAYLRALTGTLARTVTGAKKGVKKGKFWDTLAYSRVVTWGREFKNVSFYVIMNELEGLGVWSREFAAKARAPGPAGVPDS